jgi:hypothetical protein
MWKSLLVEELLQKEGQKAPDLWSGDEWPFPLAGFLRFPTDQAE